MLGLVGRSSPRLAPTRSCFPIAVHQSAPLPAHAERRLANSWAARSPGQSAGLSSSGRSGSISGNRRQVSTSSSRRRVVVASSSIGWSCRVGTERPRTGWRADRVARRARQRRAASRCRSWPTEKAPHPVNVEIAARWRRLRAHARREVRPRRPAPTSRTRPSRAGLRGASAEVDESRERSPTTRATRRSTDGRRRRDRYRCARRPERADQWPIR